MRIVDLMSETLVLPEIEASARDGALAELVDHLVNNAPCTVSKDLTWQRLLAREQLASTAVGRGIAIPHAKLPRLDRAIACFGRSRAGVNFGARDGQPTFLFLTIIAPEGNAGLHLKALARAARLLMDESFRTRMSEEADASSMWRLLEEHDARLSN